MKLRLALAAVCANAALAMVIRAGVDRDVLPTDGGLLGGLVPTDGESPAQTSHSTTSTPKSTPTSQIQTATSLDAGILGLGGLLTGATKPTGTANITSSTAKSTSSHSGNAITSGTPTPSTTGSPSAPDSPSTELGGITATTAPSPATTTSSVLAGTTSGSSNSKTWQIVGVAFVCVFAVVLILVGVIFWDRIARFLGGILCGRRRSDGTEDFMPDWEKRSWEIQVPPGEDIGDHGHHYPVTSSSAEALAAAPQLMYNDESGRHPFALRPGNQEFGPGPVPSLVRQESNARDRRNSYAPMTTAELQRQNSRAAQNAYTAYA
ncbi:hypothetical protein FIBSPDRAFT_855815 [Athelia psychrophila]|uniref:Mid2 domain-containing protein n=1 Tax=Athelia psychrophila TaxID=1759441 RepID=A0A166NQE3_9AGAM|nr:hypothetical protein FIBSPDRAFT_855815 [Fibularhizoctonia sp. CBS 109695]